jgi:hypothetical protein
MNINDVSNQFQRFIQGDLGGKINILGADSIGHREKLSSYEHVSHSKRLPRYSSLNRQTQKRCEW